MTCIIGLIHRNKVFIGADSQGTALTFDKSMRKDAKVFSVNGKFLIGCSGSYRQGQLLRYGFTPPEQRNDIDDHKYMCTEFIDAIRKCLKDGGLTQVKDGQEKCEGFFLVAYKGRLYEIEDDFQVGEVAEEYNAVGCGASYALGSLYSNPAIDAKKRITQALEAAEHFSAGVGRPFLILEISSLAKLESK
jgi:ATP-dependent protease HslVU (ClpYQ) peptidase subunit